MSARLLKISVAVPPVLLLALASLPAGEVVDGKYVETVTVLAEKAQAFIIDDFARERCTVLTDGDRVAHVRDLKIERDTATIHLLDGYVFPQEPVRGRSWGARFAGLGRLRVEPPVPVERRNLAKYWDAETLEDGFDRGTFRFADDEILAIFEGLEYRPVDEVEEEARAAQAKGAQAAGEGEGDVWTDPEETARRARALFLAMLEDLRASRRAIEKTPPTDEQVQRAKIDQLPYLEDEARKAFYGEEYQGYWEADLRRVVPPHLPASGQVYVTGFIYAESPSGSGLGSEEIYLQLKTNFGDGGHTALACAYHYPDEYDPDLLYLGTSPIIDAEDHNEIRVREAKVEAILTGDRFDARSVFTVEAQQDGVRMISFGLLPTLGVTSLGWVPPGGSPETAVPLQVFRPASPDQVEVWTGDVNTLLPVPLDRGERATLVADYEGKVVEQITSGFYVVMGRFGWFPDRDLSAVALDATIWADPKRTVTATGDPVPCDPEQEKPGFRCNRWVAKDPPVRMATFNVASDVKVDLAHTERGTPVRSLAHNRIERPFCFRDQAGREWCKSYNLSKSTEMIKGVAAFSLTLYEEMFGEYPFAKLDLVPWEVTGAAQSPANLVTLPYSAFLTTTAQNEINTAVLEAVERSGRPSQVGFPRPWTWREIISHEVSHQWWGHILYWNTYRDQWLSEGFADFSSAYFLEHYDRANNTDYHRREWNDRIELLTMRDQGGETIGPVSLGYRMNSPLNPDGFESWYGVKVYRKGAFILQMLRGIFRALAWQQAMAVPDAADRALRIAGSVDRGDELFFGMMRDFVDTYRYQSVSSLQFQQMAEKHLGGELGWFFDQWLHHDGIPRIQWAYEFVPDGDRFRLRGRILQADTDFQFPVTVAVHYGRKEEPLHFYQMVDSRDYTFTTPPVFDRPAGRVTLNEDSMLLADIQTVRGPVANLGAGEGKMTGPADDRARKGTMRPVL